MQAVVKPIVFTNYFNKRRFLAKEKNDNCISEVSKNMVAIDYEPEGYKARVENGLINKLKRSKGSFFVISNLQFAYISRELKNIGFNVKDVNFIDSFGHKKNIERYDDLNFDEIDDFDEFFYNCEMVVNDVLFSNLKNEKITVYKNGTIGVDLKKSSNSFKFYLEKIRVAYFKSQDYDS